MSQTTQTQQKVETKIEPKKTLKTVVRDYVINRLNSVVCRKSVFIVGGDEYLKARQCNMRINSLKRDILNGKKTYQETISEIQKLNKEIRELATIYEPKIKPIYENIRSYNAKAKSCFTDMVSMMLDDTEVTKLAQLSGYLK